MGDVEIIAIVVLKRKRKTNEIIYTSREENNEMILSWMTFPKYGDIASYTIDSLVHVSITDLYCGEN